MVKIKELEKEGKNKIWTRLLKNSFAPLLMGKFDFVVGNPPWVRWSYLPEGYRDATLKLWKDYGLFSLSGMDARLGAGEKAFSMLFTYVAADRYLKKGEKLAFLITHSKIQGSFLYPLNPIITSISILIHCYGVTQQNTPTFSQILPTIALFSF